MPGNKKVADVVGSINTSNCCLKITSTLNQSNAATTNTLVSEIPESIQIDSELEEDMEQIQHAMEAAQHKIEQDQKVKLKEAKAHIKKKCEDWEDQKKKEEKEQASKEKAEEEAWKRQLSVRPGIPLYSWKLTGFQMLQKQKDVHRAWQEVGV